MTRLEELRAKHEGLLEKMRALLEAADADEKRDLTDEETAEYDGWDKEAEKVAKEIKRREKLEKAEADTERDADKALEQDFTVSNKISRKEPEAFRNIGEFIHALVYNRDDRRLQDCEQEPERDERQQRDSTMASGVGGGFAVPEQFRPQLLSVDPQQAVFRPRANVIPAGDPPDAEISMPTLDQTSAQNVYGGVVMYKVGEGATLTETNVRLKKVSLTPEGIGGYIQITEKLLRNWAAASSVLEMQLRLAMTGFEDTQFYSGNGVMGPTGILTVSAGIEVSRATANTIVMADIRNMMARIKMGGSFVWIASQTTMPQLMNLQGGNSENILIMDASKPMPTTLMGIPLVWFDRSVALGTKGDLILCDLNYYLIKNGSGPFVAASEHYAFINDLVTIKITNYVDGKPWLTAPLPLEGSTSNTVSPFVILK